MMNTIVGGETNSEVREMNIVELENLDEEMIEEIHVEKNGMKGTFLKSLSSLSLLKNINVKLI